MEMKLNKQYILKETLGYKFIMWKHKDENNNVCFTLAVSNKGLEIEERVLLTNPTYIVGMFYGGVQDYMFDVIESAISLKLYSLGLTDVIHIRKCVSAFEIYKAGGTLRKTVFIPDLDNYDELYSNLEDIIANYKKYL